MSEFVAIVKVVAEVVVWIIEALVDCLLFFLLVASSVLPWRFLENFWVIKTIDLRQSWREKYRSTSIQAILLTVLDCLAVPVGILALISPFRWISIYASAIEYREDCSAVDPDLSKCFSIRYRLIHCGLMSIWDVLASAVGVLVLVSPIGRQVITYESYVRIAQAAGSGYQIYSDSLSEHFTVIFAHGVNGVLDLLYLIPVFLGCWMPTTWPIFYRGFLQLYNERPAEESGLPRYTLWDNIFSKFRVLLIYQCFHAWIDVGCLPFLFVALISPIRCGKVVEEIRQLEQDREMEISNGNLMYSSFDSFEYAYNVSVRKCIVKYGFLSVSDLFLLPMLLPLFITQYRFGPVRDKVMNNNNEQDLSHDNEIQRDSSITRLSNTLNGASVSLGLYEVVLIMKQFSLLLVDAIVLLPLLPFLYITYIRFSPVYRLLQEENVFLEKSFALYSVVLKQFVLIVVDIVFLPLTLVLITTYYRSKPLYFIWKNDEIWNDWFTFHEAVVKNIFVVIHDIALLLPAVVVTLVLAPYRAIYIRRLYLRSQNRQSAAREYSNSVVSETSVGIALGDIGQDNESEYSIRDTHQDNRSTSISRYQSYDNNTNYNSNARRDDSIAVMSSWSNRMGLWSQFFAVFLDIPFFIMAIILILTIWRSSEMFRRINDVLDSRRVFSYKHDTNVRCIILSQFVMLIFDSIYLVPFSVVLGTLYRFPLLCLMLYARSNGSALQQHPLHTVFDVSAYCRDLGGVVLLFTVPDDINLDESRSIRIRLIGNAFWSEVEKTFGASITSLVRSFFPLHLSSDKSMNRSVSEFGVIRDVKTNTAKLWVHIDVGSMRKDAVVENLRKLSLTTRICMQIEGCQVGSRKLDVLIRTSFGIHDLAMHLAKENTISLDSVIRSSSLQTNNSSNNDENRNSDFKHLLSYSSIVILTDEMEDSSENLVNSFRPLVWNMFVQIWLDLYFCVLFSLTLINPLRFFRLLWALLEPSEYLTYRVCRDCLVMIGHADSHLLQYRGETSPILYRAVKALIAKGMSIDDIVSNMNNNGIYRSQLLSVSDSKELSTIENMHLAPYRRIMRSLLREVSVVQGGADMHTFLIQRRDLHHQLISIWFKKFGAHVLLAEESVDFNRYAVVVSLLSEEHDSIAAQVAKNRMEIESCVRQLEQRFIDSKRSDGVLGCFSFGIFHRSIEDSRRLIESHLMDALFDVLHFVVILGIICTVIRALPLIKDLSKQKSFDVTSYEARQTIMTHLHGAIRDAFLSIQFLIYSAIIVILVVPFPSFSVDIVNNLSSLQSAVDCAKRHLERFLIYLYDLFALLLVIRTYRVVLKATLYGVLVPGACLAEALPVVSFASPGVRFGVGFAIWIALLAGAIKATVTSVSAGFTNTSTDAQLSCESLIGLVTSLLLVLLIAIFTASRRAHYRSPNALASTAPGISWSYMLAVVTGPLEATQLAAVVMFFFWTSPDDNNFGVDHFSAYSLRWGQFGGNEHGLRSSMALAAMAVVIWGVAVSIPLTTSSSSSEESGNSLSTAFKDSAAYEFAVVLISRLFPVWVMATLMRSSSCFDDSDGNNVLTTLDTVRCGDAGHWASKGSLALLVFYVITSSIMHADDANLLKTRCDNVKEDFSVRFAPLYAMIVRFGQLFVLVACMGGFWARSSNAVLAIIIVISLGMASVPFIFSQGLCSVESVIPLRSAGWLCVVWTSVVCLSHQGSDSSSTLAHESSVFIGWMVIYIFAIGRSLYSEIQKTRSWDNDMERSGLTAALEKLGTICDNVFEQDRVLISRTAFSRDTVRDLTSEIKNIASLTNIAVFLLKLEEVTLPERLDLKFLKSRNSWRKSVKLFIENDGDVYIESDLSDNSPLLQRVDIEQGASSLSLIPSTQSNDNQLTYRQSLFHNLALITLHLVNSIRPMPCSVHVTRQILTTILSRKLPREVCFHTYSYIILVAPMKAVIDIPDDDLKRENFSINSVPSLELTYVNYSRLFLDYGVSFILNRIDMIRAAAISLEANDNIV